MTDVTKLPNQLPSIETTIQKLALKLQEINLITSGLAREIYPAKPKDISENPFVIANDVAKQLQSTIEIQQKLTTILEQLRNSIANASSRFDNKHFYEENSPLKRASKIQKTLANIDTENIDDAMEKQSYKNKLQSELQILLKCMKEANDQVNKQLLPLQQEKSLFAKKIYLDKLIKLQFEIKTNPKVKPIF